MYQCLSIVHADPAKRDVLIQAASALADLTRQEEGNLSYDVLAPEGREDLVILAERWDSEEHFQAHVAHADEEGDRVFEFGKPACNPSTRLRIPKDGIRRQGKLYAYFLLRYKWSSGAASRWRVLCGNTPI